MGLLGEIGDMMILTGRTLVSAVRPPYTYGNEFTIQFLFALRLCWLPLLITSVCINYAVPGIQGGSFAQILGSLDRLGGLYSLAAVREFAPIVCAIIVSGVAGTAITADLGARKIREELDALQVLGVDPVKNLVVPRFLALMLATALFDIFAIAAGVAGGMVATLRFHAELGPFFATFWASGSTTEVWGSLVKCTLYGAITAIICCYKGMTTSGGAEGVGRAVNQAVVISLLANGAFNYVFTQTLLATHPELSTLR
jgi:phospholipid/cholesterol/gamma-HCH transport system permease protein